jgi:hypothetical protein
LTIEWNRETGKGNITWFWWCWMRWRQENQEANGINSVGIPVFIIDVSLMLVLATWLGSFHSQFFCFPLMLIVYFYTIFRLGLFSFSTELVKYIYFFIFNSIQKKRRKLNLAVFFHRGWVTCLVVCVAVTLVPGAGS